MGGQRRSTKEYRQLDIEHIWHPYTQMQAWQNEAFPVIVKGDGVYLYDNEDNKYIDGNSSLWVTIHGHNHPYIINAMKQQLDRLDHTTMLGTVSDITIEYAAKLKQYLPKGLEKIFFSDNGSSAVEIAAKMAYGYHKNIGKTKKKKFISFRNSYHGDMIGTMSLSDSGIFHSLYKELFFDVIKVDYGYYEEAEHIIRSYHEEIAAIIIEPITQCASGITLMAEGFMTKLSQLCREHGIILIADEVATGFGRTGKMWACDIEGITPDIICLSKGITNGTLPFAVTACTQPIYDSFLGRYDEFKTFFHGHTYTGNPLGAAAALATLEVFDQEDTLNKLQPKIKLLKELMDDLADNKYVREIRQAGFIAGIDIVNEDKLFPIQTRIGHQVALELRKKGIILRPIGNVMIIMPPLSLPEDDLRYIVTNLNDAIYLICDRIKNSISKK